MFRLALILAALSLTAGTAEAISRYAANTLTCEAARQRLDQEGAVIFRYPSSRNPSHILYDRFVRHAGHCSFNETTAARSIPAADGDCLLMICRQRSDDFRLRHGFGD